MDKREFWSTKPREPRFDTVTFEHDEFDAPFRLVSNVFAEVTLGGERIDLMEVDNVSETVEFMRTDVNEHLVNTYIPKGSYAEGWDPVTLQHEIFRIYGLALPVEDWAKEEGIADEEVRERIQKAVEARAAARRRRHRR
mgnify:CR=1 FL=1